MDKDKTINIFIAYSRDDENFLKQLEDHFSVISRDKSIQFWWDGMMSPGQEWDETIKEKLNQADIILLLVSSSFFASDYINSVELPKALQKHEQGIARVIPIILRTCAWQLIEDIGKLQALPQDGKAVSTWPNADDAYTNIIMAVQKTVETIRAKLSVPGEQEVKEEEVIVPEENPVIETGWSSPVNISQPSDSNAFPQKDLASEGYWKEDKTIVKKPVEKPTEPVDQEHSNREEKTLEKEVSTNTLELKLSLEQMAKHYGYPMKEMGPNKFSIDLHFPVDSKTIRYQLVYVWISDIGRGGKPCIYMSSRVQRIHPCR